MGNAWIDPATQYMAYADYAYATNLIEKNSILGNRLDEGMTICNSSLQGPQGKQVLVNECENLLGLVSPPPRQEDDQQLCTNLYNITVETPCGAEWPEGLRNVTPYLRVGLRYGCSCSPVLTFCSGSACYHGDARFRKKHSLDAMQWHNRSRDDVARVSTSYRTHAGTSRTNRCLAFRWRE